MFGEHFVVYGNPAIAMAIDKRVYVESEEIEEKSIIIESDLNLSCKFIGDKLVSLKGGRKAFSYLYPIKALITHVLDELGARIGVKVRVRSELFPSAGLGSSAAIAVATTASISKLLNHELTSRELFDLSSKAERMIHFKPSGIDQTISIKGGVIKYVKGGGIEELRVSRSIPLVIGFTGKFRRTGEMVSRVAQLAESKPELMRELMSEAKRIVDEAVEAMGVGDLNKLGELMSRNQCLLERLGVSSDELSKLISIARNAGAVGAKLTGAGGGGCVIALAMNPDRVEKAMLKAGFKALKVTSIGEGVRVEAVE